MVFKMFDGLGGRNFFKIEDLPRMVDRELTRAA